MTKRTLDGDGKIGSVERVTHAFAEIAESTDPGITLGGLIHLMDLAWKSMRSAKFLNMSYVDILRTTSCNDNVVVALDDALAEKMLRPQLFCDWSTDLDSLLALRFFTTQHVKFRWLIETVCEDMVEYEMTDLAEELSAILCLLDEFHMTDLARLFDHIVAKMDDNVATRMARIKREELPLLEVLTRLPELSCDWWLLRRIRASL